MKWLKKFNELKSITYRNAANKIALDRDYLGNIKNKDVHDRLHAHADDMGKLEMFKKTEEVAKEYSKYGVFNFSSKKENREIEKHNYYLTLYYDNDIFSDSFNDWYTDGQNSILSIPIAIGLIPADNECSEFVYDNYSDYLFSDLNFYPLYMWIYLRRFSIDDAEIKVFNSKKEFPSIPPGVIKSKGDSDALLDVIFKDDSTGDHYFWDGFTYIKKTNSLSVIGFGIDEWSDYDGCDFKISDIVSGVKFKKLLIDIFGNENSDYNSDGSNLREKLQNSIMQQHSLSSEFGFELDDIADYFKQCNRKRFYN